MSIDGSDRPRASVLIPAFREEEGIRSTLSRVTAAVSALERYAWEIIVVDDGSPDATSDQVRRAAAESTVPIQLVRHLRNQGLGGALRTGFAHTHGTVVVVLDSDLSYDESHIARLVEAWETTRANVVIASPYLEGGTSTSVPPLLDRRSRIANRVLSTTALDDIKTLTGMVRAYDGPFVRGLSLKAVDVDINVEILYKTQLLRGTIVEIPGHLNWSGMAHRASRGGVLNRRGRLNTAKSLVLAFLYRPFWFPLIAAAGFALVALTLAALGQLDWHDVATATLTLAVILAVNSLSMLQAKRYFEELYFQSSRSHARYVEPPGSGSTGAAGAVAFTSDNAGQSHVGQPLVKQLQAWESKD